MKKINFNNIDPKVLAPKLEPAFPLDYLTKGVKMSKSKKYRLKKWYPSLPKVIEKGDIANLEKSRSRDKYAIQLDPPKCIHWLNVEEVENNPEFWEEVGDNKEYKILSFTNKSRDGSILPYSLYDLTEEGDYIYVRSFKDFPPKYSEGKLLNTKGVVIRSVKRLSDGEVFTIGDQTNFNEITGFTFKDGRLMVTFGRLPDYPGMSWGTQYLCNVHHKEEPLFTTKDGVDIYEGDLYHEVRGDASYYSTFEAGNEVPHIEHTDIKFSTKEKAEEYIEEHKPRYSKADIREAYQSLYEVCKFGDPFGHTNFRTLINQLENE